MSEVIKPNIAEKREIDSTNGHFHLKRHFFDSGETLSYSFRKNQLRRLREAILKNQDLISKALYADLKKSHAESYLTEIGPALKEIDFALKHLKRWMRPKRRFTPILLEPSSSKIYYQPKGVVLIISPWNYPFYLSITALIGAIAAGNCAILKPSEEAVHTSQLVEEIIHTCYGKNFVSVVLGEGSEVVPKLTNNHIFNHIHFTGSPSVGKIIAHTAAENLISTTLELGGKSPAIVHSSAQLKVAARRIAWGKFINAGQTCVAPDYLIVESKILDSFLSELKKAIFKSFGKNAQQSRDYPRMINLKRFDAVAKFLSDSSLIFGGKTDRKDLYIEPTLLLNPGMDSAVMKEEIFGPVLPILTFENPTELLDIIKQNNYPLSAYFFGTDKALIKRFKSTYHFGSGSINDTIVQLGNPNLPFGGIMGSGTGQYHGKYSFECFSHQKSIVHSRTWFDPPLRYPPFSRSKLNWYKRLF